MANDGLEESMMQSLASPDLLDVAIDWGELGLDAVLNEGVLKEVPIISSIVGLAKAAVSVRDKLFAKKVVLFLVALEKVPHEERERQIQRLAADPKERRRVGEQLLLLLDRLNDMRKPELLARAFHALLKGTIKPVQFQSLAQVIDNINHDLIPVFSQRRIRGFSERIEPDAETSHFLQCGLVTIRFAKVTSERITNLSQGSGVFAAGVFRESELGTLFHDIVIQEKKTISASEKK